MNKKTDIKNPYGAREFIIDIIIAIPTILLYYQIAGALEVYTKIITALIFLFCIFLIHFDILTRWNRKMYHENKKRRKERRIYIQAQQEEEEWSYYDL